MWRSLLAAMGTTVVLANGCGSGATPISPGCTENETPIVTALKQAPGTVTLADGFRLSQCISDGTDEAELQNVGITFHRVAEDLRVRARDGNDRAAAIQLGYLIGATRRGAKQTNGVMAELQRRVELVGGRLQDEAPTRASDVQRGLVAGERLG
jgi:hypothetical protein